MIKFNFQRIFNGKGIEKPFSYLISKGYSRNMATRINTGKLKTMNLKDVERFCLMFECTPNDLLEWMPEKFAGDASKHPLSGLVRVDSGVNIKAILNAIPIAQLEEIEKIIREKTGKQ